ncbi:hypothetical protein QF046_001658 [Microbacterium sp. W4I4]|nr:hypothetical protein [Microbacterium sp. W4I4]
MREKRNLCRYIIEHPVDVRVHVNEAWQDQLVNAVDDVAV